MKRVRYRDVTSTGQTQSCALEMRIYKRTSPRCTAPPYSPCTAGSWAYRGGGAFMGLEATISHYTEQGFTRLCAFYRTAGAVTPARSAVARSGRRLSRTPRPRSTGSSCTARCSGRTGGKVAVTGQSAGAHLSGWLITHRPDDVSAGLLHRWPHRCTDMLTHARPGGLYEPFIGSLGILSNFFGADVTQVDINNPPDFVVRTPLPTS